jgi:hypothetical protein
MKFLAGRDAPVPPCRERTSVGVLLASSHEARSPKGNLT